MFYFSAFFIRHCLCRASPTAAADATRAWIALEECGVDYETVTVDLQDKPQDFVDLYAKANPLPGARAKVPLLHVKQYEDDEENQDETAVVLCESLIVAEYIAEQFGSSGGEEEEDGDDKKSSRLLPESAQDRATMRLFTELCGSSFSYFPLLRAKGDKLAAVVKNFQDGLVAVNSFLAHYCTATAAGKSGPFLFGTQFSLAECNAAPFVQRSCIILPAFLGGDISVNPLDICDDLGLVHLKRWMEAVLVRPSVCATGVAKEELLQSTTKMLERFAAMEN